MPVVGYQVCERHILELSYRYVDLGDRKPAPCTGSPDNSDNPFEFRHLTSQDIRLGMRFYFGASDYPPPPPPLRSKG